MHYKIMLDNYITGMIYCIVEVIQMSSDAAKRATAKYQREKMESISIRVKRSEGLSDQIKQAATVQGVKPAQFIKQAIQDAIHAKLDGPPPDHTTDE